MTVFLFLTKLGFSKGGAGSSLRGNETQDLSDSGFLRRVHSPLATSFFALYFHETLCFHHVDQSHGDGLPIFFKAQECSFLGITIGEGAAVATNALLRVPEKIPDSGNIGTVKVRLSINF